MLKVSHIGYFIIRMLLWQDLGQKTSQPVDSYSNPSFVSTQRPINLLNVSLGLVMFSLAREFNKVESFVEIFEF
jgi:hypothetical protein